MGNDRRRERPEQDRARREGGRRQQVKRKDARMKGLGARLPVIAKTREEPWRDGVVGREHHQ